MVKKTNVTISWYPGVVAITTAKYYAKSELTFCAGANLVCSKKRFVMTRISDSHWHRSDVFTVSFEHISHLVLVFLLITFSRWVIPAGYSLLSTTHFAKTIYHHQPPATIVQPILMIKNAIKCLLFPLH